MDQRALVRTLRDRTGIGWTRGYAFMRAFTEAIRQGLIDGDYVYLHGIGTFLTFVTSPNRIVRLPRTGRLLGPLPQRRYVKFHPSSELKRSIRKLPISAKA